jgi:hypothetical protein
LRKPKTRGSCPGLVCVDSFFSCGHLEARTHTTPSNMVVIILYIVRNGSLNSPSTSSSTSQHTATATCYLDGCMVVLCPSWGCGPIVTTTISSYIHSTQNTPTLIGNVKIIPGTTVGVYFFGVGSVQYHLVFCDCQRTSTCNCPKVPALSDGRRIKVTGIIVTPSTYGSVWAPGGDIYVQTWAIV